MADLYKLGGDKPHASVTVGVGDTAVLAAEPSRTHARFKAAIGNTEPVFLALTAAAAILNQGYALEPGDEVRIDHTFYWAGAVSAICLSGGQTLHVFEA